MHEPKGRDEKSEYILGKTPRLIATLDWKFDLDSKRVLDMKIQFTQGYLYSKRVLVSEEDAKRVEQILQKYFSESTGDNEEVKKI